VSFIDTGVCELVIPVKAVQLLCLVGSRENLDVRVFRSYSTPRGGPAYVGFLERGLHF